jgi:antitoxin component YwqK of YwqJK toxin-antitoxin module
LTDDDLEYAGIDAGGGSMFNYRGQPFTGIIEEFDQNDTLVGEMEFRNGYKDGVQRLYCQNSQMEQEYFEKYKRFYDTYKYWDANGNLIRHIEFDNEGNEINRIIG